MKKSIWAGWAMLIVIGGAQAADEPQALVKKSIDATGGTEKLAGVKGLTWKEKGTYYGGGEGVAYEGNYARQFPDKFRMEIVGFVTMIVNGDKGWAGPEGGLQEMEKEALEQMKEDLYVARVTRLVGLDDKAFTLTAAPDAQVAGQPAAVIVVAGKGHGDIKLFFDKKTSLLVKTERRAKAAEQGNQEVTQEVFFSNHKDVNGVKLPTKTVVKRDGKNYVEAEQSDFKFEDKLDEKLFSKP